MKKNTQVPVSIKIRVDGGSTETFNNEIAQVVSDAGADFLIVHGRHWSERYDTPCHHNQIKFFVDQLKIPVIGNGDVSCVDSLKKMFETGCAGVMIGRAGVGQPWLIKKLTAQMQNEPFLLPIMAEIGRIFMVHVRMLSELLGSEKLAVLQARKFAKYYGRDLKTRMAFILAVNCCETLVALEDICHAHFKGFAHDPNI